MADVMDFVPTEEEQAMDEQIFGQDLQPTQDDPNNQRMIGVPRLAAAPPYRNPPETIPATKFAPEYRSIFTLTDAKPFLATIKHVNCSYLSTPGLAPTLLELKQHVHGLINIIKSVTVTTLPGIINNRNMSDLPGADQVAFRDGETYDFLNDLAHVYEGPSNPKLQHHHNLPLTSLLNVLEEKNIREDGKQARPIVTVRDICPLHRAQADQLSSVGNALPYATHQALIGHANEVLELIDHEYSAKGGLLSILPPKDQKEDREKAESTLLGQMILHMQRMVLRLHDLERLYANSMDVLAGEALVPHQALSRLGPDGRKGRELVYPQDRFVLVNAGEDVWQYLISKFREKERIDELVMRNYKANGLTGEALWETRGKIEMDRGITALDITTRYYRLKNDPLKTIFVIPAHQDHPGVKVTRDMEKVPQVVTVVKPIWPERASMWELKNRTELQDYKRLRAEFENLKTQHEMSEQEKGALKYSYELAVGKTRQYEKDIAQMRERLTQKGDKAQLELLKKEAETFRLREEAFDKMGDVDVQKKVMAEESARLHTERTKFEEYRREQNHMLAELRRKIESDAAERERLLEDRDREQGEAAKALTERLRERWMGMMVQTQIVYEALKESGGGKVVEREASKGAVERGEKKGESLFEELVREVDRREGKRLGGEDSFTGDGFIDGV